VFKNKYLFLFSIIFFYYLIPLIFFKYSYVYKEHSYTYDNLLGDNYIILSIGVICFFIFVFIKFSSLITPEQTNKDGSKNKIFYLILKFFLLISVLFILSDIFKSLIFWYENYENFNRDTRAEIYKNILNKRLTYIKITIIASIFLYKIDKVFSLVGIFSIVSLDLLTLSRFNTSILIILFFLNNLKINKKNIIFFTFIIFALFSYRPIIQYLSTFLNNTEYNYDSSKLVEYYVANAPGEFFAVFTTLILYLDNLVNLIAEFLKFYDFSSLLKFYLIDNYNFFLKSFLYVQNVQVYNYWDHNIVPNKWANHGATFIISYLPLLFLYYYVLKKVILLLNKININFTKVIVFYILSMSFRGNIIHEIGFSIKLTLLLIIAKILIETIQNIFNKKS
jgi:hypothetical protein